MINLSVCTSDSETVRTVQKTMHRVCCFCSLMSGFFMIIVFTQTAWCSCFPLEAPSGQIWRWWCLRYYKKPQWGWKAAVLFSSHSSVSSFFSSFSFCSHPATHLCSTRVPWRLRVWLEFIWTSPRRGDNRGRVIDMCRRTQDKQPTPRGVTPACLIHFDWAKTERWDEKAVELKKTKSRDEMTQRKVAFTCFFRQKWRLHANVKSHTWCINNKICALEENKQRRGCIYSLACIYVDIKLIYISILIIRFLLLNISIAVLFVGFLFVWHGQSSNGLEICVWRKKSLFTSSQGFSVREPK